LKVLGLGGSKLDFDTEAAVTLALNSAPGAPALSFVEPAIDESAQHEYAAHLRALVPGDLSHLSIVLDCANGAASNVAHELFEATDARITTLHDAPNGHNINEQCGSTHPESLIKAVLATGADLGLAFDGDADRLIAVDASGTIRDGDDLMVLFALDSAEVGDTGIVVTSMSNLGLHRALTSSNVDIVETDVGDRNVLIALEERSWPFGGEQSGHLIFRHLSPTGDGLLTGLRLCELVARRGPLGDQADAAWTRMPQVLVNIDRDFYDDAVVRGLFDELRESFGIDDADVRLLIRPSGTEPLVRVMIEALDAAFVDTFAARLQQLFD